MHRSLGRSIVLIALAVVLAACGATPSAGGSRDAPFDRDATLRVALYYPPSQLDPHKATSSAAGFIYIGELYDRLTELGPDLELEPMLAQRWDFAPDGRSVTFALREGPKFWDGSPVDATAVKASLDRALTLPGSTAAGALSMIASVDVLDARTLRITTNRPAADLPYVLAGVEGSVINPAALASGSLDREPAGSGPYRTTAFSISQSVELERVDGYWDPAAQQARRIVITGIPNDNTRLSALRSGDQDLIQTTLGQFRQASGLGSGYVTHTYPAATTYAVYLNTAAPNLDRTAVRQALNWAVDRQAISDKLLDGQCTPTSQPLGPAYPGYLKQPPIAYGHDPERARQLLAQAGVGAGFRMRMLVPSGLTIYEQIATAVQAQLREVGVGVELVPQEPVALFSNWTAGTYDGLVNNLSTKATAGMTLAASYLTRSRFPGTPPQAFADAVNRTFDPALDDAARDGAIEQASGVATQEAMGLFLCSAPALWTSTVNVVGADRMGLSYTSNFGDLRGVGVTRSSP